MKKEKNQAQKAQEQPTDVGIYIAALRKSFSPALSPKEATHWFSTDEVVDAIRDIDPGAKLSKEQVHQALHEAGYEYCAKPGTQALLFRWMMRNKE